MMKHGNAVVGQSGGPTSAINATLAGVIRGARELHEAGEIGTLYGMRNGIDGFLAGNIVDLFACVPDDATEEDLVHTPAAALGSCRKKLASDPGDPIYDTIFQRFAENDIRYFFYIGGNDSMDTVAKLKKASENRDAGIRFVGVPKTIDNDLSGTDHTPGFGSAAKYIAVTMEEIIRDCSVYTIPAVTIVEIMGRDAGWLTAAAALPAYIVGEGPDLVYVPERSFDTETFIDDVKAALSRHPNVVVAVSEGARTAEGTYVGAMGQSGAVDVFGHQYLAGTGKVLEHLVKDRIGCKVRSIELSLPQRCAGHLASATDLAESRMIGREAVYAAKNGASGVVMAFVRESSDPYRVSVRTQDVFGVANAVRTLPDEYINEAGNGITKDCADYIAPLIRGEAVPRFENGLPVQFKIIKS